METLIWKARVIAHFASLKTMSSIIYEGQVLDSAIIEPYFFFLTKRWVKSHWVKVVFLNTIKHQDSGFLTWKFVAKILNAWVSISVYTLPTVFSDLAWSSSQITLALSSWEIFHKQITLRNQKFAENFSKVFTIYLFIYVRINPIQSANLSNSDSRCGEFMTCYCNWKGRYKAIA